MTTKWHEQRDFVRLCERGAVFEGEIPLEMCEQIASACTDTEGQLAVRFVFDATQYHQRYIQGSISGVIRLECQRCAEPVEVNVERDIALSLVPTEESSVLDGHEALCLKNGIMSLIDLISDEVLLGLPLIVKHPDCSLPSMLTGE